MGDHDAPPADGLRSGAAVVKHLPRVPPRPGMRLRRIRGSPARGHRRSGPRRMCGRAGEAIASRSSATPVYPVAADVRIHARGGRRRETGRSGATRRGCEALSPLARVRRPGRPLSGSDHPRDSRAYLGSHRWAASGRAQRIPAPGVPSPAARAGPHASTHPLVFANRAGWFGTTDRTGLCV